MMGHSTRWLAATLVAAVLGGLLPGDAGAQSRRDRDGERVDTTFAFGQGGSLVIELPNMHSGADVIVTGWNRNEVRIDGETDDGRFDIDISSRAVTIGARGSYGPARVDRLTVSVPVNTRVRINNTGGDISVSGTRSAVDLVTFNGDVSVSDASERVDVKTFNGDVEVERVTGRVVVNASNGDVQLDQVRGDIEIGTLNGDVDLTGVTSSNVKVKTMSGEITYDGTLDAAGQYSFDAFSGGIDLAIPSGTGATLSVSTYSGSVDSDFPLTLRPGGTSKSSRGKSMTFTLGNGGANITLESFSGEIRIRERRAAPRQ